MRPLEIAENYMTAFFSGGDPEVLRDLLSDTFTFRGPLYRFDSAEEYIIALKADPPEDFEYKMIRFYEDESSACLVYQFIKPGVSTTMTQVFEVDKDKISKILLVFDSKSLGM